MDDGTARPPPLLLLKLLLKLPRFRAQLTLNFWEAVGVGVSLEPRIPHHRFPHHSVSLSIYYTTHHIWNRSNYNIIPRRIKRNSKCSAGADFKLQKLFLFLSLGWIVRRWRCVGWVGMGCWCWSWTYFSRCCGKEQLFRPKVISHSNSYFYYVKAHMRYIYAPIKARQNLIITQILFLSSVRLDETGYWILPARY